MEGFLFEVARAVSQAIEFIAILVIAIGVIEFVIDATRMMIRGHLTGFDRRAVWLRFTHWLVAGLTLQLAADIVQTTLSPTWEEIGRVGAVAVIRTFLTFFLDRDVEIAREQQNKRAEGSHE